MLLAPPAPGFDVTMTPPAVARVFIADGQPMETIAVPGVKLGVGEALVAIELATVCGSDVHTATGARSGPTPSVLGHEYVGRIVQIGDDSVRYVDGAKVRIGDRVVWSIFAACLACDRCQRGMPQKCRDLRKYGHERVIPKWELSGGFATHAHLLRGTSIVRAPENLPAAVLAPATCGTATAWAAIEAAAAVNDLAGATVLVTGGGLIGLTAVAMATVRGARVILSDPDPARRELAARFGAAAVANPTDRRSLSGALSVLGDAEIDVVIEASGARAAVTSALAVAGVGAVIVYVGSVFPTESIALDPEHVVRSCLTIRGVHNYPPEALVQAVSFLSSHASRLPFEDLVGARFPLAQLDEALRVAGARSGPVRVGITLP